MTVPTTADDLKHGLFLQNAPSYIDDLATPSNAVAYAIAAEQAGWDGVFLADAFGSREQTFVDPWITHASIAARTERISLGTWITPVPRRQPWQLASELATLDELSAGRVILGAGLGAPWNYETTGIGYEPAILGERYDEALEIIVELWKGEPVTYDGTHFTLDGLQLPITPVQEPRIPIVMGCWWPNRKPFRRAGEWDGIMPAAPSFYGSEGVQGEPITGTIEEEVSEMLTYYREGAANPGEIIMPIDVPEAPADFVETCRDQGMTWTLTTSLLESDSHEANLERIREGPPV